MAVPLDQQFKIQKKGIIEERIAVLHPSGMQQHYFVTYLPVPMKVNDGSAVEQWLERMTFLQDDLTWLLSQNHPSFWCEVIYNKDFHSMLDSYLRYAPRPQRTMPTNTYSFIPNGKELEENLSRLMFMCILRLSTHKESSENFFTPQGFGRIIYENYIFDVPRLFDICSLYAINNRELLSKMIGNIFKQQQEYTKDLKSAILSIIDVISNKIRLFHTQNGPKKLNTTTSKTSTGVNEIVDLLCYILDLSCTINRLFSVYPEGRLIFFREHFHLTLITLFETFLRAFERSQQSNEISVDIEIFEEAKYETITLFNDLLATCCIDPLLVDQDKSEHVESLIHIFSLLTSEKRFLAAYEDYFSLLGMIEIVHQTTGLLDDQQLKFYTDAVKEAIQLHGTPSCQQKLLPPAQASASGNSAMTKSTNPGIQMIQDLFPHLEEKYIQRCLNHYNNNSEQLVNALFDNAVPEYLASEPAAPIEPPRDSTEIENPFIRRDLPLLEQRSNVYDNDEFDVFNQSNIDLSRIHRGKKTRDAQADLDDKSHLVGMTERYARLGIVEDLTDGEGDYDDEYDDTYDEGIVNVRDKYDTIDNELEKNENRITGKQPGHYRHRIDKDNEDDDDDDDPSHKTKRREFVENPEVVRERWAQQRAAMQQRHRPAATPQPQVQHDVVGNARGRGQSGAVAHNRRWKDAHKSSQGNHNRRDRAAQKANRGLFS